MTRRSPQLHACSAGCRAETFALLTAALLGVAGPLACQSEPEAQPRQAAVDAAAPAESFAALIDELSGALEGPDATAALAKLRALLNERKADYERVVGALESQALSGASAPSDQQALVEDAMQRFARAQQQFRARANEAQKVELSELLNSLR